MRQDVVEFSQEQGEPGYTKVWQALLDRYHQAVALTPEDLKAGRLVPEPFTNWVNRQPLQLHSHSLNATTIAWKLLLNQETLAEGRRRNITL